MLLAQSMDQLYPSIEKNSHIYNQVDLLRVQFSKWTASGADKTVKH